MFDEWLNAFNAFNVTLDLFSDLLPGVGVPFIGCTGRSPDR